MKQTPYTYKRKGFDRYIFTSIGRSTIVKLIDFSPTEVKNLYNIGFGDMLPDGTIDDKVNSNNGDIIKVLSTVMQVIRNFTSEFPEIKIFFTGSTEERIKLYARILRTYYEDISNEFVVTAFVRINGVTQEVTFSPQHSSQYFAFFVKSII
jgi:hypothetical protein